MPGGRKKDPIWENIERNTNGDAICKFCKQSVSEKVERIKNHLEKCGASKKNQTKDLVETGQSSSQSSIQTGKNYRSF
jgi:hypothetical protein